MSKKELVVDIGLVSSRKELLQKTLKIPETNQLQLVIYTMKGNRRTRWTSILPHKKLQRKTRGSSNRFVILFNKLRVKLKYRINKFMGRRVNKFIEMRDI